MFPDFLGHGFRGCWEMLLFDCPLSVFHSMAQQSSVASCTLPQELNWTKNWKGMLIYWILMSKRKINLECKGNYSLPPTLRLRSNGYLRQTVPSLIPVWWSVVTALGGWGQLSQLYSLPASCPPLSLRRKLGKKWQPWCSPSTAQLLPKHWWISNRYKTQQHLGCCEGTQLHPVYHDMVNLKIHFVSASLS